MEYGSAARTSVGREFQMYGSTALKARVPALVLGERGRISSLVPEAWVLFLPMTITLGGRQAA